MCQSCSWKATGTDSLVRVMVRVGVGGLRAKVADAEVVVL
jgi:hypothetical protein